ncbi:MAG: hypothetical protein IKK45_02385 [Akkermansia sp.]|nr:hypothetical protein [Akkermansia sp.]
MACNYNSRKAIIIRSLVFLLLGVVLLLVGMTQEPGSTARKGHMFIAVFDFLYAGFISRPLWWKRK